MRQPTFLGPLQLLSGAHDRGKGMCAMEAAAYLAGEQHSDSPECVSPVIAAFMRRWNDGVSNAVRQGLKPLIPRVLHTATGRADELTRAWLVVDWSVRERFALWLERGGLRDHAIAVRALAPITGVETAKAAAPVVKAARRAARDALAALGARAARDALAALGARDALAARDARDARAALAALGARDARDALGARDARDALDALDALAALAALDALDALDARDALAALGARDALAARDALDALKKHFEARSEEAFQSRVALIERLIAVGTVTERAIEAPCAVESAV